ncbi:AAA family ATPase [Cryptosporangium arvum]|uniref:ATPase, dynein-related subfamily n=1 Tax=Cryptosporangium arvum DSM 44712 TaxID=927661 RepID=A0A010Z6Q8_9ACTN|nr:MoxR family ATPase [Cryptosporangium arvum]EXG82998.1 ATPase, dynein-related subfamily [Cryptosporangium arvum DSM 44712]
MNRAELQDALRAQSYLADDGLVTAIHLAGKLELPLLLEGEPGVGKTEVATALARVSGRTLIRLQCYEGLDAANALYEWDYPKQLLHLRSGADLYAPEFLLERPLLAALRTPAVLLVDEIDRADAEFEAFLLEFLADFRITIPELGPIHAETPPIVVLTSNRTRDLHDALKRRCLYHWIPYPDAAREREIVRVKAPGLDERSAARLVDAVNAVRDLGPVKRPGVAESIAWARGARVLTDEGVPWPDALRRALGLLVKYEEDVRRAQEVLS